MVDSILAATGDRRESFSGAASANKGHAGGFFEQVSFTINWHLTAGWGITGDDCRPCARSPLIQGYPWIPDIQASSMDSHG